MMCEDEVSSMHCGYKVAATLFSCASDLFMQLIEARSAIGHPSPAHERTTRVETYIHTRDMSSFKTEIIIQLTYSLVPVTHGCSAVSNRQNTIQELTAHFPQAA